MKKAMIALSLLASMAYAGEMVTLSPSYSVNSGEQKDFYVDYTNRDSGSGIMNYFVGNGNPGHPTVGTGISFTMDVSEMLGAERLSEGQTLTLKKFDFYACFGGGYIDNGLLLTIAVQDKGDSVTIALPTTGIWHEVSLTLAPENQLTFDVSDNLVVTLAPSNNSKGASLSILTPKSTAEGLVVSGISTTMATGNDTYNGAYAIARMTVETPEPATATLSLLALAGLAARRRRH